MNMKDIRNVNWDDNIKKFGEIVHDREFEFRPGVYGICYKEDKVLIVESTLGRFILGGGVEDDESDEECLKREFCEEIGHGVNIVKWLEDIIEFVEVKEWGKNYMKSMRFYLIELGESTCLPTEEDHIMKWLDIDDAVSSMYLKGQSYILNKYRDIKGE